MFVGNKDCRNCNASMYNHYYGRRVSNACDYFQPNSKLHFMTRIIKREIQRQYDEHKFKGLKWYRDDRPDGCVAVDGHLDVEKIVVALLNFYNNE